MVLRFLLTLLLLAGLWGCRETSAPSDDDDSAADDDDDTGLGDDDDTGVGDDDDTGLGDDDDDDTSIGGSCTAGGTLDCALNNEVIGNNGAPGSTQTTEAWGCYPDGGETGPEFVYSFAPTVDRDYTITVSGLTADLDLYILQDDGLGCDPANCIGAWLEIGDTDETTTFSAAAGVTYYVAIDGWDGAVSDYTVTLDCGGGGDDDDTAGDDDDSAGDDDDDSAADDDDDSASDDDDDSSAGDDDDSAN